MTDTLTTTRWVPYGTFIGQLITPAPGAVGDESRIPCYIGKGSRLATGKNLPIRRSYITGEALTFSSGPIYTAPLTYPSDGDQRVARLIKNGGNEVPRNQWSFVKNNSVYDSVLVNPERFDTNATYEIDYQSSSRDVKDQIPVNEIREVVACGSMPDRPEFVEYQDYILDATMGDFTRQNSDLTDSVHNPGTELEEPVAASDNTGAGAFAQDATSEYTHNYNRYYGVTCTASDPGEFSAGSILVDRSKLADNNTITLNDGVHTPVTFRIHKAGGYTPAAGQIEVDIVAATATSDIAVADVIRNVINAQGSTLFIHTDAAGSATINLFNDLRGAQGDQDITLNGATVTVNNLTGGAPRTADFSWTSTPMSGGNSAQPVRPLPGDTTRVVSIIEDDEMTPSLENGIKLKASFGAKLKLVAKANITTTSNFCLCDGAKSKVLEFANTGTASAAGFTIIDLTSASTAAEVALATKGVIDSNFSDTILTSLATTTVTDDTVVMTHKTGGNITLSPCTDADVVATDGFEVDDAFTFNALGPALIEFDSRMSNTNQWAVIATPERIATGNASITAVATASLTDHQTFTINDGIHAATTFELDFTGAGVADGHVQVNLNGITTANNVAAAIRSAITAVTADQLSVDAVAVTTPAALVTLTREDAGTITITQSGGTPMTVSQVTGTVAVQSTAVYTGTYNTKYVVRCKNSPAPAGGVGSRTADFGWAEYGDRNGITGSFQLVEATPTSLSVTLPQGVKLTFAFGAGNFASGDTFIVTALAPRQNYHAKDDRAYTFTIATAPNALLAPGVTSGSVTGSYVTDTPEGSFGTWTATANSYTPNSALWSGGQFTLPGNVCMVARNLFKGPVTAAAGNRHYLGDVHKTTITLDDTINWSLTRPDFDNISSTSLRTDVNGQITGTPNTKYVVLTRVPLSVKGITRQPSGTALLSSAFTWIAGTQYIKFTTNPFTGNSDTTLRVSYEWRSAEPDPGTVYYFTGNYVRPDSMYNTPFLITTEEAGKVLLAPASRDNHLYIMNQLAWANNVPACYFIQVKDEDADDVYTTVDFNNAIVASEPPERITDVVVLSNFASLNDLLASVDRCNDPFKMRERIAWIGAQSGTSVGNVDTTGSIVNIAKTSLVVYGESPSHGSRTMSGHSDAVVTIQLPDRTVTDVVVDGSFIAGAFAAMEAALTSPGLSIIKQYVRGFKSITVYGDVQSPENLALGEAQCLYVTDVGNGVYQLQNDETVDDYADDFKQIMAMAQKQFVTRYIRREANKKLIGLPVALPRQAAAQIQGFIASALDSLVARTIIAPYQDAAGNQRPMNPLTDVVAFVDSNDRQKFNFQYGYWLRSVVKRLFGLYSVNQSQIGRSA